MIPRDFWLEDWEKEAIVEFYQAHPGEGYRRLTYMMLDKDVVAVSPSSVYRVLDSYNLLRKWPLKKSSKGDGFEQPTRAHEHWHIDVSYINIRGTFYYLMTILDGYSRFIVHWEIRDSMTTGDVEITLQRAKELYPDETPRIISDNGPQFISKDFKEFIKLSGMTHVRTSPYYPQSNGKVERWHQSLKRECIRPKCPLSLEDARRIVSEFVDYYNDKRLHCALGYIAPRDMLLGNEKRIFAMREHKLALARKARKERRQTLRMMERTPNLNMDSNVKPRCEQEKPLGENGPLNSSSEPSVLFLANLKQKRRKTTNQLIFN